MIFGDGVPTDMSCLRHFVCPWQYLQPRRDLPFGACGCQINPFEATDMELKNRLRAMDVNNMTPLQAFEALEKLKKMAEGKG